MDTEKDFLILLSEVARHIRTHGDRNARKHGMTWAQLMILSRLERQPGLSQNELAAIAEVAPITVTRFVDRMGKLRFVRRQLDPKDRRIWRLRTTPSAVPALRDSKRCSAKLEELVIKGVDTSALDAMVVGLRKLKANLSKSRRPVKASREGCPMPSIERAPEFLAGVLFPSR